MLRDPALVPLSRQHQHALALCVRIERAPRSSPAEIAGWQAEIVSLFQQEIWFHFNAEERVLFPAAARFPELRELVKDLLRDHNDLRAAIATAESGAMTSADLASFAARLSAHIRREERELFEGMQKHFSSEELHDLGVAVEDDFRAFGMPAAACSIPPKR
jgi:hemerythrin-like domain-containing protein